MPVLTFPSMTFNMCIYTIVLSDTTINCSLFDIGICHFLLYNFSCCAGHQPFATLAWMCTLHIKLELVYNKHKCQILDWWYPINTTHSHFIISHVKCPSVSMKTCFTSQERLVLRASTFCNFGLKLCSTQMYVATHISAIASIHFF